MFVASRVPRKLVGLFVAALALTVLVTVPQSAQAVGTGGLSGTVTASDTGLPVPWVAVDVSGSGARGSAVTDGAGHWTVSGLAAGDYKVYFSPQGTPYQDAYLGGDGSYAQAVAVTVTAGQTISGLDVVLKWFPSVSGTVSGAAGGDVSCVYAWLVRDGVPQISESFSYVNSDGKFAIDTSDLAPGRFTIMFFDECYTYAKRYLGDVYNLDSATSFYAGTGDVITGKNATLAVGATISGTLTGTAAADRAGIAGLVSAWSDEDLAHPQLWQYSFAQATVPGGSYEITGLQPGAYHLSFWSNYQGCTAGYRAQSYNGAESPWTANTVTVGAGQAVTGIDAQLTKGGGSITGHVVDAGTSTAAAGVRVTVETADGNWIATGYCGEFEPNGTQKVDFGSFFTGQAQPLSATHADYVAAVTDVNGNFTLPSVPDGSYVIHFSDGTNLKSSYLGGAEFIDTATPVTVSGANAVNVGTVSLGAGGTISGTMNFDGTTQDQNSRSVLAMAFKKNPATDAWELMASTDVGFSAVEPSLTYQIPGLAAGTYKVGFFDFASRLSTASSGIGYAPQFFGGSVTLDHATDVVVTAGATTAHTDVTLSALSPVDSERFAGASRYDTSVAMSKEYAPGVPVVYVATGTNFPDALAAAPAAAAQGGPLLLVTPTSIPDVVLAELQRLNPASIVVVGGEAAVNSAVYNQLTTLTPTIKRESGADRYETARAIIKGYWTAGTAPLVYVATGLNFPDALSAAAAAGAKGAPVLTVNGAGSGVDAATADLLDFLGTTKIAIAGGKATVSPAMETSLKALPGVTDVWRYAGANRYATGAAINHDAFTASDTVYLASGKNFPDALSGAALAGLNKAPLYIVPGDCVPASVLADITTFGATTVRILGGTSAVSVDLNNIVVCS